MARTQKHIKASIVTAATLAGLTLGVIGCGTDGSYSQDFFPAEGNSPVNKVIAAQAAVGARYDATLHPIHFDGPALNSLGLAKLDEITTDLPDSGPVSIYVDVPVDGDNAALAKARTDAVSAYLIDSHLTADQFTLVAGANPGCAYPAASAITNMAKTETSGGSAYGGASGGGSGAASSTAK